MAYICLTYAFTCASIRTSWLRMVGNPAKESMTFAQNLVNVLEMIKEMYVCHHDSKFFYYYFTTFHGLDMPLFASICQMTGIMSYIWDLS